jgi:hypothetical protein
MLSRARTGRLAVALFLVVAALPVLAQDAEQPRRSYTNMLNVDALIDNYARLLARKYNLTAEQDAFTQAFLRERTQQFLERYRDQLFPLVDRMFEVRNGGEIDQAEMMNWGRQVLPLFEEAKRVLVQSNNEWRGILTEDQRKIHDTDVQLMNDSFASTSDQLTRIVSGQMTVDEFRRGPRPPAGQPGQAPPAVATPGTPGLPPAGNGTPGKSPVTATPTATGGVPTPPHGTPGTPGAPGTPMPPPGSATSRPVVKNPAYSGADFESQWEAYVREFTQKYQLDEAQKQRAQVILKDCQDQGRNIMSKRKSQLDDLDKRTQQVNDPKLDAKERTKRLQELGERRTKILEPIGEIFERALKPRLERLLTSDQKKLGDAKGGARPGTQPGVTSTPGVAPGGVRPGTPGGTPPPNRPGVKPGTPTPGGTTPPQKPQPGQPQPVPPPAPQTGQPVPQPVPPPPPPPMPEPEEPVEE